MKIFEALLGEIQAKNITNSSSSNEMHSMINVVSCALLDEKYKPSDALKKFLDKLKRRVNYPMEVAIVGQFSSGKSTFLNALLGRDVLPTGITPVTSKVNFINYGDEYKIEVTYNSGAKEFHSVEYLAKFTDQRETLQDIKYLSLFAPLEILRDISFVDTPGLNSQSNFDTKTTTDILRSVDGIIWLGLIDAVAKKSELDILEEYLDNYASKSICLLNQKDRISEEEVEIALAYADKNYKNFFSKIVAISAKEALDAQMKQESLETSNMQEVLNFIEEEIRPKAKEAKLFSLKQTVKSAISILQDEYTTLTGLYEDLVELIEGYLDAVSQVSQEMDSELSSGMELLNLSIQECIEFHVGQIHRGISKVSKNIAQEEKSLLGTKYIKHEYTSYELSVNAFDSATLTSILEHLENLQKMSIDILKKKADTFEKELILWKMKVLKTQKKKTIASDEELFEIKYFAAAIFEEIFQEYQGKLQDFKTTMSYKKNKLSFMSRFELAYEKTISGIHFEIVKMQNAYEKDPTNSLINSFDESEILLKFKENLDFEYIKRETKQHDSFVNSAFDTYTKELQEVSKNSINKVQLKFNTINAKVKSLDEIML